jgi:hypothetical protein
MNSPKQNKRYLAHILALLALVVYLASANYIFCYLLTVDGEAQVCSVNIPEETGNIKYYIDTVEEHQIDWKCLIAISGWAFIEGKDACNSSTYVVIKTETEEYTFDTSMETRPDVTQHFANLQLDLDESGFYSNIPLEHIPDGTHQIGIMISRDGTGGTSYILTNTYVVKRGKNVEMERRIS